MRYFFLLSCFLAVPALAGTPITLEADRVVGEGESWVAEGSVDVQYDDRQLQADRVEYRQDQDQIIATGHVKLTMPNLITEAPEMRVWVGQHRAVVTRLRYQMPQRNAHGQAEKAEQLNEHQFRLTQAEYTSCQGDCPPWRIKARRIDMDQRENSVVVRGGHLDFFNVPILYSPYFAFPTAKRHSGFLAPSFATSDNNGAIIAAPFYWNMAADTDATLTPRYLSKRGMQVKSELRYLRPQHRGALRLEALPADRVTGKTVYAGDWQDSSEFGALKASLDLRAVSYREYLSDFSSGGDANLPYLNSSARLDYRDKNVAARFALKGYQELAQTGANPYQQLPNLTAQGQWPLPGGLYTRFLGDINYFVRREGLRGQRWHLAPALGARWQGPAGYLEPVASVYYTQYRLERSDGLYPQRVERVLPSYSLSGKLVFEKSWRGGTRQTVEPHFRYLYIPTRAQQDIPLFDTDIRPLTYPLLFEDNLYAGYDRINGANRVTMGLTMSWFSNQQAQERLRLSWAQIRHFKTGQVDLSGQIVDTARQSDSFFVARWQMRDESRIFVDAQGKPEDHHLERLNIAAQWRLARGVINLGSRYTRDFSHQGVVSGQWQLSQRWRGMAMYRYGFVDKQPLEYLAGFNYDGGCWASQFMAYRQLRLGGERNNVIYLQILLRGLTNLGSRPAIGQWIPGAQES